MELPGYRQQPVRTGARALVSACAGALAVASSGAVHAQEQTQTQASAPIEEVIVTARKREESIMQTPVVVDVVTLEKIEDLRVVDMPSLAAVTPGLQITPGFGAVGAVTFLRGIGNGSSPVFIDQSVQLNVDGMSLNQGSFYRAGAFDLAQIEVMKGPQSLFFGKSTSAGIIALSTADPTSHWDSKLSMGYEFAAKEKAIDGYISGPLTETVGIRVAGYYTRMDGYLDVADPADPREHAPDEESYGGRLTLRYKGDGPLSAKLKYGETHTSADNWIGDTQQKGCWFDAPQKESYRYDNCKLDDLNAGGPLAPGYQPGRDFSLGSPDFFTSAPHPVFRDGMPYTFTKTRIGVLNADYEITPSLVLNSTTGYARVKYGEAGASGLPGTEYVGLAGRFDQRDLSQELRLTSSFDHWFNFMVGGIYTKTKSDYALHFVYPSATFYSEQDVGYKGHTYSGFGQVLLTPIDKWELSLGVRYTSDTKKFTRLNTYANTIPFYNSLGVTVPNEQLDLVPRDLRWVKDTGTTPEATLTWRPTKELTVFGSYKRGFKGPGFGTNSVADSFFDPFVPGVYAVNSFSGENVEGVEGGVKASLWNRHLALTFSAYRYKYEDQQVSFVDSRTSAATITNGDDLRIYGFESGAVLHVPNVDGLSLNAFVNYNHAEYLRFPNAVCYGGQTIAQGCSTNSSFEPGTRFQDLKGRTPYRAPRWTAQWGGEYARTLSVDYELRFATNFNYSSSYSTGPELGPTSRQDSYVTVDASVRFGRADGLWELALLGRNLTDKYVAVDGIDDGEVTPGVPSDTQLFIQRPRQIMLQVTVRPGANR